MSELYKWRRLNSIPELPGIYGWYYQPIIGRRDIQVMVKTIRRMKSQHQLIEARQKISSFLQNHVFSYFDETPYHADLKGPLKPRYTGELSHQSAISNALVERIVQNPDMMHYINRVLKNSTPYLSSPIYIGISSNVRRRVLSHQAMIQSGVESPNKDYHNLDLSNSHKERDQSFAAEVCRRNMDPTNLYVAIELVEEFAESDKAPIEAENLLNRINYPVLGRN